MATRVCEAPDRPDYCLMGQVNLCCAFCERCEECIENIKTIGSKLLPCEPESDEGCPFLKRRYRK